jgi:SnoaL-like polyketide cyclase
VSNDNMAIVGRWFASFWGVICTPDIVDELAAPDILLQYSLDTPRRGRALVKAFRLSLLAAFPDLHISVSGEPVSDRDIVVVRWTGSGTHTGPAFNDFNIGPFPAVSGRTVQLAGTNAVRLENGRIVEEAVWLRPCVMSETAAIGR